MNALYYIMVLEFHCYVTLTKLYYDILMKLQYINGILLLYFIKRIMFHYVNKI